jgi:lysophospholipase L1-like esterase
MRRIAVVVMVLCFAVCGRVYAAPGLPYYLALGDSLSRGIQPLPTGRLVDTNQGYVDGVYSFYRLTHPLLQVAKLACSGESTKTMVYGGGGCAYPLGTQLKQAVEFLHTHRVLLVTLTIGGDDVLGCIMRNGSFNPDCPEQGLVDVSHNLPYILSELRAAAGPHVPIVAMNYFNPFLAASVLLGSQGDQLVQFSSAAAISLNAMIETLCSNAGDRVADVARAFKITDFANVPGFNVPLNAFLELTWTWIGAPPPRGPDVHPNAAGYSVIATAFVQAIGPI